MNGWRSRSPRAPTSQQSTSLSGRPLPLLVQHDALDVVENAEGALWVNRLGTGFKHEGQYSPTKTTMLLSGIATMRQIQLNHDNLFGNDLSAHRQPDRRTAAPVFAIRTRPKKIYRLSDMAESEILTDVRDPLNSKRHHDEFVEQASGCNHVEIIRLACRYRRNTSLVGPTDLGRHPAPTASSRNGQR